MPAMKILAFIYAHWQEERKTMAELKPCPFCGGKAFVSARLPYFGETFTVAVVCEDCNASSKHKIKAWNRRTDNG